MHHHPVPSTVIPAHAGIQAGQDTGRACGSDNERLFSWTEWVGKPSPFPHLGSRVRGNDEKWVGG